MSLVDYLDELILERQLEPDTELNYRRSLRFFGEWLGHPATVDDLKEITVNRWLKSIEGTRASRTVLGHKRSITVLWNWLSDNNKLARYDHRKLRSLKVEKLVPKSWTMPNVQLLMRGAQNLKGSLRRGVSASDLMVAWIMVGYESGLRPSDIRRLRRDSFNHNIVALIQHKTGVPHCFGLTPKAVAAIDRLAVAGCDSVFPASKSTMRRWENALFRSAKEFGFTRQHGQGIGTLRKTHGTEVCRVQGLEAAASSLGHISGTAIAKAHYVAPDALPVPKAPPELFDDRKRTRKMPQNNRGGTASVRQRSGNVVAAKGDKSNSRRRTKPAA